MTNNSGQQKQADQRSAATVNKDQRLRKQERTAGEEKCARGQYEAQNGMKGNKTSRYLCDLKRALSSPLRKANGTRELKDNMREELREGPGTLPQGPILSASEGQAQPTTHPSPRGSVKGRCE